MAMATDGKYVELAAQNDEFAERAVIQSILVASNSAANAGYATLATSGGKRFLSVRVPAAGNVVIPFPSGYSCHGVKLTDISNAVVYVYLT